MRVETDGPVDLSYSGADSKLSPEALTAIGSTFGQIGSSLAQRQRQFTEVEQKCGKRPTLPGSRRKQWDACAMEYAKSSGAPANTFIPADVPTAPITSASMSSEKKIPRWVWIVGGVAVLGIVGFVIYKSTVKKA